MNWSKLIQAMSKCLYSKQYKTWINKSTLTHQVYLCTALITSLTVFCTSAHRRVLSAELRAPAERSWRAWLSSRVSNSRKWKRAWGTILSAYPTHDEWNMPTLSDSWSQVPDDTVAADLREVRLVSRAWDISSTLSLSPPLTRLAGAGQPSSSVTNLVSRATTGGFGNIGVA